MHTLSGENCPLTFAMQRRSNIKTWSFHFCLMKHNERIHGKGRSFILPLMFIESVIHLLHILFFFSGEMVHNLFVTIMEKWKSITYLIFSYCERSHISSTQDFGDFELWDITRFTSYSDRYIEYNLTRDHREIIMTQSTSSIVRGLKMSEYNVHSCMS